MRALAVSLLALLALAGAAAAAPPSDLSPDPLDRAVLLALPSVYRVDVTLRVDALRTAAGQRVPLPAQAREIRETGTAFAAAPGGWLITAGHVARPGGARLARMAYLLRLAAEEHPHSEEIARAWVERTGARPVGARVVERVVRQADAGDGALASETYRPTAVRVDERADLALLRIPAPGAPALELDESASIRTPVVAIGFGREGLLSAPERGALEPAHRRGRLGRTGELEDPPRPAVEVTARVQPGDSGGPAVDRAGRVRGVVVRRHDGGGIVERAAAVRALLDRARVAPGPGRSGRLFRQAMSRFWALDLRAAERGFEATLEAFGDHTLARRESVRAAELAEAEFRLVGRDRRRGFLLALGVLSAAAALGCALGLMRPLLRPAPGDANGR